MTIGYASALVGGVLTLLSPCSVMVLPAFFAYAFGSPAKLIGRTAVFLLGLLATLVPLGVFAGTVGVLLTSFREWLIAGAGTLIIVAGVVQIAGVPMPGLRRRQNSPAESTSAVSVFLLGTVYAVAGVCAGPILGTILMMSTVSRTPLYGGLLLVCYAVGMVVPLFVLSAVWPRLGRRGRSLLPAKHLRIGHWSNSWTMIISGLLSVALGVVVIVTDGTAGIAGIISAGTQQNAESWVLDRLGQVPDLLAVAIGVALLLTVLGIRRLRRRRPAELQR
ncbi:cytochrome c biogenesis CcdA family protein [Microlunatus parietis]|uniref:Cytochrome c biogenesis protein CcdA n=1 Tax=Microlunatus parietis TaxID=682979 RepID=A0A7Y9ICI5_9ACTN|nr:cytochrome c biogenesis CcdA family protein [Microlunatus parietis]NYE74337.1 cytochrome c biogenesis protein CcdA [Microlunatus parietis]